MELATSKLSILGTGVSCWFLGYHDWPHFNLFRSDLLVPKIQFAQHMRHADCGCSTMTWVVQGTFEKKKKNKQTNMHLLYIMVKYNDHCENPSVQCLANRLKAFWIPSSPCCSSKFNMAYEEYSPQRFLGKPFFVWVVTTLTNPKYSMYDLFSLATFESFWGYM